MAFSIAVTARRRLRRARLIACDVDGTLLNADEMIGTTTARMIRAIVGQGIPFLFVTARHHFSVQPYCDEIRLDSPVISLDGALTMAPHGGSPIRAIVPDRASLLEIATTCAGIPGAEFALLGTHRFHFSAPDLPLPTRHVHWNIDTPVLRDPSGLSDLADEEQLELVAMGDFDAINRLYSYARGHRAAPELHTRLYESISHPDRWYLELRSIAATKLGALMPLVREMGLGMSEVIGIGDNINDLDFCRRSGYVVAIANAVDDMRRIADFVTQRDCLRQGIDEFLEYFLRLRGVDTDVLLGRRRRSEDAVQLADGNEVEHG